ncbi:MAG: metallophosphoesterase [bacterium]|nr:metallophosphoesterase [bacterium]
MNRIVSLFIFLTIATLVYTHLHLFVFKYLKTAFTFAPHAIKILKILFWFSGLSLLFSTLLTRLLKIHFLSHYAYIWMGIIAISYFVFLVAWVITKFLPSYSKGIAVFALCIAGVIIIFSLVNGLQRPVVKNISIPMKELPKELTGFSIVQISDLHLEAYKSPKIIDYIVGKVNELEPDLIVFTGDMMDGKVWESPGICERLKSLKATHGVVAVTGNHEFFSGYGNFAKLAAQSNIKVLRNESITIAGAIQIIGLEDFEGRRFASSGPDLEKAIKGLDHSKPMIVLNHRPAYFSKAVEKGVDLQLSGHTHAGQIPPMDLMVWFYYKYPSGLYEIDGSYIYTSPGTGYWGPPMRFLSRNEIVKITLESTSPAVPPGTHGTIGATTEKD